MRAQEFEKGPNSKSMKKQDQTHSTALKIRQAVLDYQRQHEKSPLIEDFVQKGHALNISFDIIYKSERDFCARFSDKNPEKYPPSAHEKARIQLNSWPIDPYRVFRVNDYSISSTGTWSVEKADEALEILAQLSNEHNLAQQQSVFLLSDLDGPVIKMTLNGFLKIGTPLLCNSDVYVMPENNYWLMHYCRHGQWGFAKRH